jgi:hypothetical protein
MHWPLRPSGYVAFLAIPPGSPAVPSSIPMLLHQRVGPRIKLLDISIHLNNKLLTIAGIEPFALLS